MMDPTLEVTDRREVLHGRIRRKTALLRRLQISLGKDLAAMHRSCAFLLHGATSFPLYCETFGLAGVEGLQLESLARGILQAPALADLVAGGRTSVPAAAAVARVLEDSALLRKDDDWLRWAADQSTRDILDKVRRRRDEVRAGEGVHAVHAFLSPRGTVVFLRAREVAIRGAGRVLTEGETIEVVSDDYLDRRDEGRKAARLAARDAAAGPGEAASRADGSATEAAGPTASLPHGRHVPAAERRRVLRVAGDRCRVEGCGNAYFLDYCHRQPFRTGGENTAANLFRFCRLHHRQFDGGQWKVIRRPGGDLLVDRAGIVVGRLAEAAAPDHTSPGPDLPSTVPELPGGVRT